MQAAHALRRTIDAESLIECLDAVDEAVWVADVRSGQVAYANPCAAAWFAPDRYPRSAGPWRLDDGQVLDVIMREAASGVWQVGRACGRTGAASGPIPPRADLSTAPAVSAHAAPAAPVPAEPSGACAARPERPRTLLVVDDEASILSALKRVLRRESYCTLTAGSGAEGLAMLAAHEVDVIISDQRMPGMTGVEFLRKAKERHPATVRMVLSGYTDLQSVTDAINEGAIYKFLTKPWDDALLKANIEEAFRRKALSDQNRLLAGQVQLANTELTRVNAQLNEALAAQRRRLAIDKSLIEVFQAAIEALPLPVLGVDEDGLVVLANAAATRELASRALVGAYHHELFPAALAALSEAGGGSLTLGLDGRDWEVRCSPVHGAAQLSGFLYAFLPAHA